jgi:hypothetical protein
MIHKFLSLMNLQRTSLAVGMFGVSFQIFVLNPWHEKISIQLNSLENKINKINNISDNISNYKK